MGTEQKRILCECSKLPQGAEKFTDAEGAYIMSHPQHTLYRKGEHHDFEVWECNKCKDKKTIGTGDLREYD